MSDNATLYYVHDPMCSWCWGFNPTLQQLKQNLPESVEFKYLLGGLAADSVEPMPVAMQTFLQQTWRNIEQEIPGTVFNFDFWTQCQPRRSTYPACRALIAARNQSVEKSLAMIESIQLAYYTKALNPSDDLTLIGLADKLELDLDQFRSDLNSEQTQSELQQQIQFSRHLGVESFPSLVLQKNESLQGVSLDYLNATVMLEEIEHCLEKQN